jgi:hypothetical protein
MMTSTNLELLQRALDAINKAVKDLRLAAEVAKVTEDITTEQARDPEGGLMLRVLTKNGDTHILRSD